MNTNEAQLVYQKIADSRVESQVFNNSVSGLKIQFIDEENVRIIIKFKLPFGASEVSRLQSLGASWCVYSIQPEIDTGLLHVGVY